MDAGAAGRNERRMRVITCSTTDSARLEERIGRYWNAVVAGQGQEPAASLEVAGAPWLDGTEPILREVHPDLSYRMDARSHVRIVCADPHLRPLVERLLDRAPEGVAALPGAGGGSLEFDDALGMTREMTGFDLRRSRVRVGFGRGHLLEIVVQVPGLGEGNDDDALEAADVCCEALIGEYQFDDWVGGVAVEALLGGGVLPMAKEGGTPTMPLSKLADTFVAATAGLLQGLPDEPCVAHAKRDEWAMLEIEPEAPQDRDFAALDDVVLATSAMPEMLKCCLQGAPFHSRRFSRFGETFGFLKLDGRGAAPEARLARRRMMEDAVDSGLAAAPGPVKGGVVGNATGLRYDYIVVALPDPGQHGRQVIDTVRRLEPRAHAWLQFCDTRYEREWLGSRSLSPPGF